MEMPLADVVDRYTILLLKKQKGLDIPDWELDAYHEACLSITSPELFTINSLMWDLEEEISQETDLSKIGVLYLALRGLTKRRVEAKNRIASQNKQPLELKSY